MLDSIKFVDEVSVYYEKTEDQWLTEFEDQILARRFPEGSKIVMFHSEELRGKKEIPGEHVADEIVFVPRKYISTSEIIDKIARSKGWKRESS